MELKFRPDGKFRIMQIADIQDTQITSKDTVELIEAALDKDKPDLVVFTGDQIKGYGFTLSLGNREENFKKAFDNFLKPVDDRNIPFTFCFGNHDAQAFGISKEKQLALYKSYPNCVAERGDESLEGVATTTCLSRTARAKRTFSISTLSTRFPQHPTEDVPQLQRVKSNGIRKQGTSLKRSTATM